MRNIIFILTFLALLFVVVFVASGVRSEWNRHLGEGESLSHSFQAGLVVLGNRICPVSGDDVREGFSVTYQNKEIGLCCPSCKDFFLQSPGKYL